MLISVVSPVYEASEVVDELVQKISQSVSSITDDFEIILVEDGSSDDSWLKIQENCKKDKRVKGIKLSRNFGQHMAITAGLEHSFGDYVVVMDCDLQNNPKYVSEMYERARSGFDIVFTRAAKRSHSFLRNAFSGMYSFIFNWLSDNNFSEPLVSNFSLLTRRAVNAFCRVKDSHRHYLLILRWLGFKSTYVDVSNDERLAGKSSYTFFKLWNHALDGIISQSNKLLRAAVSLGLVLSFISILLIGFFIFAYFAYGFKEGWTSVVVLILFSTGVVLTFMGILGIYVGKTFEQTKNRPLYLIDERVNFGVKEPASKIMTLDIEAAKV